MGTEETTQSAGARRLLSGIRPTGPLHLGHYVAVVRQWLAYQETHECFFLIADVQALATHQERPELLAASVREVALDLLAAGLDPKKGSFLIQSQIPELATLTLILQMLVRTGELRQNPIMREEARALGQRSLREAVNEIEFGLFGYPVSQVADMLLFTTTPPGKSDSLIVPVADDQLPHVELAAMLADRFNRIYAPVFLEPEARTGPVGQLPGTDGGYRMGTTERNSILLTDTREEYAAKIRDMFFDPLRVRPEDPGHPDACPCFAFLSALGCDADETEERKANCASARSSCETCQEELVQRLEETLRPHQERRVELARDPGFVEDVLTEGPRRAREVAAETMAQVRKAMQLDYPGLIRRTT